MANASCNTCTLVSNVLTLAGAVSGTVLVGMTITAAGVPAGVTITSLGTGTGQAGTYNCSSSAANVSAAEAMVFSLSWDMPLQGNASTPQLLDLGRAAGFGLIIAAAVTGGSAGPGQEYQFGTHQAALYDTLAISGTQLFRPASSQQGNPVAPSFTIPPQYVEPPAAKIFPAATKTSEVNTFIPPLVAGFPQAYDFTLRAALAQPLVTENKGFSAEYQFGLHQKALYDSQAGGTIFPAARTPPVSPLVRSFQVNPQELARDLTQQGWIKTVPVAQGWLVTMVTAGPQYFDFTLQAQIIPANAFFSTQGPWAPTTIISVSQADPTQIQPSLFAPPTRNVPGQQQPFVVGTPTPWDPTQNQGQIIQPALPGPSKFVQPAFVAALEPQFDKQTYPVPFTQPTPTPPPGPPPGFRVMAVTAGWYLNVFRTPGDVFDLVFAADFSDAGIDYQPPSSNTVGYGWMKKVAATTPLVNWLASNNAPYLPPQDPLRRFIM